MPKKSGSSLQSVANVAALRTAWLELSDKKTGDSRDSVGIDGESVNQFANYADENLRLLSFRLQQHTPYQFLELKPHVEPKAKGGDRIICVPTVRDRIVQRSLLNYLVTVSDGQYSFDSAVSYGFLKGKSTRDAIAKAKATRKLLPWAYKADITSFFDSIDRTILRRQVRRKIPYRAVYPLLFGALNCEVRPSSNSQKRRIKAAGIRRGHGIRQGMPLSPYLANLILSDFDRAVQTAGFEMVRYADDLIFFARSQAECENIHSFCVAKLLKIGLSVHPIGTAGKTTVCAPDQSVEFLGVELVPVPEGYRLEISAPQIAKKKTELIQMSSMASLLKHRVTVSRFLRTLDAKIQGWTDSYKHCDNLSQLTDMLRDCRRDVIQSVIIKELGIANPNQAQRQFLELDPLPPRHRA